MRRAQLEQAVQELITLTFHDAPDVAEAIREDEAFGALVGTLQNTGWDREEIAANLSAAADDLDDRTLDWLAEQASNPAAFIASRI